MDDVLDSRARARPRGGTNQRAMLDRLSEPAPPLPAPGGYTPPNGNTGVSGYGGSTTSRPVPPVTSPAPAAMESDPGAFIRNLLATKPYGAESLKSLKGAFGDQGYNVWTATDGGARGIITDPNGKDWNVLDPNESMDWWKNQTGQNWNPRIEQRGGGGSGGQKYDDGGLTGPSYGDDGLTPAFLGALMKLLNPTQASLADPDLASQSQANEVAQQRSYERRRAADAEQAATNGTMGGGFDAAVDTAQAARGDAVGAFNADLLARKNDQNRESQLAALGPSLSLMGLHQNESQFGRSIGLQKALAEAGLNQDAILRLLAGL